MTQAMKIVELVDALAKHRIFLSESTIRKYCKKGLLPYNKDFRGWIVFPDGEATIARIKGLYNGTIKLDVGSPTTRKKMES